MRRGGRRAVSWGLEARARRGKGQTPRSQRRWRTPAALFRRSPPPPRSNCKPRPAPLSAHAPHRGGEAWAQGGAGRGGAARDDPDEEDEEVGHGVGDGTRHGHEEAREALRDGDIPEDLHPDHETHEARHVCLLRQPEPERLQRRRVDGRHVGDHAQRLLDVGHLSNPPLSAQPSMRRRARGLLGESLEVGDTDEAREDEELEGVPAGREVALEPRDNLLSPPSQLFPALGALARATRARGAGRGGRLVAEALDGLEDADGLVACVPAV
jgi:hypothetical protein